MQCEGNKNTHSQQSDSAFVEILHRTKTKVFLFHKEMKEKKMKVKVKKWNFDSSMFNMFLVFSHS